MRWGWAAGKPQGKGGPEFRGEKKREAGIPLGTFSAIKGENVHKREIYGDVATYP